MSHLSVITICFNNLEEVKLTCASVDAQTMKPAEHLIVDGSTNTVIADWLATTPQPAYRKWMHIPGEGIVDSFNRGIVHAAGDITHLLNSGDSYAENNVIEQVINFFSQHEAVQWVSAKLRTLRSGHIVEVGKPFDKNKIYRGMRSVLHPTWFVKRQVYDRIGLYDKQYRIAMDYDMMCRIGAEPYAFIDITTTYFDNTGVSTIKYLDSLKENIKAYESHFGYSIKCRLWQFRLKMLHLLLRTGFGKALYSLKKALGLENL
ncbi:glycosyltransferase [Asinibacterium sp. OR53]|uniref:glycosyltransferase n=1 Tax=Asinibacterium sp. OR53 TaxID=925409 RepID=UPI00047D1CB1|nr:glycosyltransferase [Asinibacterium sp. OR53]